MLPAINSTDRNNGLPRWFDVTVALACLLIAAPLVIILCLAIALTSGLPVLFRQQRVGRFGRRFNLYKLRTMRTSESGPQITTRGDARVTRLGRVLRKTKLDELPTFWNVLRGDLALVGPRPEVPGYVNPEDPLWQKILATRPGLTDPVTLRLRNEEDLLASVNGDSLKFYIEELQPKKLRGYIDYLECRDWRSDLRVLGKTMTAIIAPGKSSSLDEVPMPGEDDRTRIKAQLSQE
jgi:lipopolysaccharide/colanic/teichoic acid biosynthesis glycosyltransferase